MTGGPSQNRSKDWSARKPARADPEKLGNGAQWLVPAPRHPSICGGFFFIRMSGGGPFALRSHRGSTLNSGSGIENLKGVRKGEEFQEGGPKVELITTSKIHFRKAFAALFFLAACLFVTKSTKLSLCNREVAAGKRSFSFWPCG